MAIASRTLFWMPRATRRGATATSARAIQSAVESTKPVTVTPSCSPSRCTSFVGREPTIERRASGNSARTRGSTSRTKCTQPSTLG